MKSNKKGKSRCPFCGGTKTVPFLTIHKSQECRECDGDGKISNKKLIRYELNDFIQL